MAAPIPRWRSWGPWLKDRLQRSVCCSRNSCALNGGGHPTLLCCATWSWKPEGHKGTWLEDSVPWFSSNLQCWGANPNELNCWNTTSNRTSCCFIFFIWSLHISLMLPICNPHPCLKSDMDEFIALPFSSDPKVSNFSDNSSNLASCSVIFWPAHCKWLWYRQFLFCNPHPWLK